jgi:hypothetical protein
MQNPFNNISVVKRFNGIDILQVGNFVKISCKTFFDKIVSHHGYKTKLPLIFQFQYELAPSPPCTNGNCPKYFMIRLKHIYTDAAVTLALYLRIEAIQFFGRNPMENDILM